MRAPLFSLLALLLAPAAMAQDATTEAEAPAADPIATFCEAQGKSEDQCSCEIESMTGIFSAEEMADIREAAATEDPQLVAAAVSRGIGIDLNKNDFYNDGVAACD
ncbi:hypothetical protein [Jannaschia aquimarina]|uniref:Uncharacterized protein n=1 Tax=Jannaschia aquimarina TaxID=935700 RepID=A0A0D1EI87_9RHOB|nr:hypothetical protein [Jannaschia aquimarina]KIT16626.1 hypothetical protein jaqu_15930 [Jannaschia aquimarina]SNS93960.1 hypothetical protein SAMN05421775_103388 [Jannaschia aquimarina]